MYLFLSRSNYISNNMARNREAKSQQTIMHLPCVNLGAKFQPNGFDAHLVEKTLFTAFSQVFVNSP